MPAYTQTLHVTKHNAAASKIFLPLLKEHAVTLTSWRNGPHSNELFEGARNGLKTQDPPREEQRGVAGLPVVQTAPLWLSHPGPVTAAGPRLENDAKPWLAETHVGVRRVWWAGAALQRPAGDIEVPHRPPPSRGGKEPGTRPAAPASPASWPRQPQPAPRDPACLRSRRPAPRLTSPRLAPPSRRASRCTR